MVWPVEGARLWRGYRAGRGNRRRGKHDGLDLGAAPGTPIRAARSGLVVYSDNGMRGYGNVLFVVHSDGSVAIYAHNSENRVFPGEVVSQGEVIALVGDTGLAHGAHLHFELREDGVPVDPLPAMPAEQQVEAP